MVCGFFPKKAIFRRTHVYLVRGTILRPANIFQNKLSGIVLGDSREHYSCRSGNSSCRASSDSKTAKGYLYDELCGGYTVVPRRPRKTR